MVSTMTSVNLALLAWPVRKTGLLLFSLHSIEFPPMLFDLFIIEWLFIVADTRTLYANSMIDIVSFFMFWSMVCYHPLFHLS